MCKGVKRRKILLNCLKNLQENLLLIMMKVLNIQYSITKIPACEDKYNNRISHNFCKLPNENSNAKYIYKLKLYVCEKTQKIPIPIYDEDDDEINECSDDNIFNFNDQTGRYTTKLFYETIDENGIIDVE